MKYTEEILSPRTTQTVKNLLLSELLMKTMAPEKIDKTRLPDAQ